MKNLFNPPKFIKHRLASATSEGGNAFVLMGKFSEQARKEGWSEEEIKLVMQECTSIDYEHLRETLQAHCK